MYGISTENFQFQFTFLYPITSSITNITQCEIKKERKESRKVTPLPVGIVFFEKQNNCFETEYISTFKKTFGKFYDLGVKNEK